MLKRSWFLLLIVVLLTSLFPVPALAATSYIINDGSVTISASGNYVIEGKGVPTSNTITVAAGVNANITLKDVNIDAYGPFGDCAFRIADNSTGDVNITLSGNNVLKSGSCSAGLMKNGNSADIGTLTINGTGFLTTTGFQYAAGIGGGNEHDSKNIIINGGTITASGGSCGAGIGGGDLAHGSNITINSGTVTANGGRSGAGIGGGYRGDGSDITINGGTVIAHGNDCAAGIGGGNDGNGKNITISGGTVTAKSDYAGAGIGGGFGRDGRGITISGGTVTANGGFFSAGIGGGKYANGNDITVSGGTVKATGGTNGAGIGGGWGGNCSNIIISGDKITAIGGENSPAVGSGNEGTASGIKIKPAAGERVTVKAGASASTAVELSESPFSSETTYTGTHHYFYAEAVGPTEPPATPSIAAESASYSSVKVSWNKISGASGYQVYRATSSGGSYTKVYTAKSGSTVSYTNTDLKTGKTYYYKMRAYRTVNGSPVYGSFSSVKSAKPVPAKPSITAASASYSSVKVSWNKITGASGYQVYRATSSNGSYTKVYTAKSGSTVNYTNTDLKTGKTYYYKVRAYRTVNETKVYGKFSSVKSVKPVPATPKVTVAAASASSIKVSWKKITGASGYEIYRATSSGGTYTKVYRAKSGSTVSYADTGLTSGKTYYYKVRAYRTVGETKVYGSFSSVKSVKTE